MSPGSQSDSRTAPGSSGADRALPRPAIAVSMGDPNGIGPEIVLKALSAFQSRARFDPLVAGVPAYLRRLADLLRLDIDWDWVEVVPIGEDDFHARWGEVGRSSGRVAREALETATRLCGDGRCEALVTAPVSKKALRLAGFRHRGHTDYLADTFGCSVSMAFLSDLFHVLLATGHVALADVAALLSTDDLVAQSAVFYDTVSRLQADPPKIAVCGLNPHASEEGLMGDEEARIVEPAVVRLQGRFGPQAFQGPLAADTLFWRARRGDFDAVVALYHDQGLIPLKTLAFETSVNTTLGLPFVRTSPDHGTAFDIAGRAAADPGSMTEAFRWALRLTGVGT